MGCYKNVLKVYNQRKKDTNKEIRRIVIKDGPVRIPLDHWIYVSDQWVYNSLTFEEFNIPAYNGPRKNAPKEVLENSIIDYEAIYE